MRRRQAATQALSHLRCRLPTWYHRTAEGLEAQRRRMRRRIHIVVLMVITTTTNTLGKGSTWEAEAAALEARPWRIPTWIMTRLALISC